MSSYKVMFIIGVALCIVIWHEHSAPLAQSAEQREMSHEVWNYCGSVQNEALQKRCFDANGGSEPLGQAITPEFAKVMKEVATANERHRIEVSR